MQCLEVPRWLTIAESLILTTLRGELPQIGILSEEAGYDGDANYYWIVDPLDGSANFQHASPIFGIAIALMDHQTAQASLIYLPARDEMFTAIRGQGAYLNDARIHVSEVDAINCEKHPPQSRANLGR